MGDPKLKLIVSSVHRLPIVHKNAKAQAEAQREAEVRAQFANSSIQDVDGVGVDEDEDSDAEFLDELEDSKDPGEWADRQIDTRARTRTCVYMHARAAGVDWTLVVRGHPASHLKQNGAI